MGKKYALLEKRVEGLESQLIPILAIPPNPETLPYHQPISEEINQQLLFLNKLLSTEIAASSEPEEAHHHHLAQVFKRVCLLQSTVQRWAQARPTLATTEPGSSSTWSCTEYDLADEDGDDHDDDHVEGEESPMEGFTLYDNPEFVDRVDVDVHYYDNDDDDDDDKDEGEEYEDGMSEEEEEKGELIEIHDQRREKEEGDKMEECEGIDEEEIIRVGYDKEDRREKARDDSDSESEHNCCFRVIFVVLTMGMGFIFMMAGLSDFSDHHHPPMFLTPT